MTFAYEIERRDGGSVLRFVHSGALPGDDWQAEYDALQTGDPAFIAKLETHLKYFRGRQATPLFLVGSSPITAEQCWAILRRELGVGPEAGVGAPVRADIPEVGEIDGVVEYVSRDFFGVRTDDAPSTSSTGSAVRSSSSTTSSTNRMRRPPSGPGRPGSSARRPEGGDRDGQNRRGEARDQAWEHALGDNRRRDRAHRAAPRRRPDRDRSGRGVHLVRRRARRRGRSRRARPLRRRHPFRRHAVGHLSQGQPGRHQPRLPVADPRRLSLPPEHARWPSTTPGRHCGSGPTATTRRRSPAGASPATRSGWRARPRSRTVAACLASTASTRRPATRA